MHKRKWGYICRRRGEMLKKDKRDRMIENKQRKGKKTWKQERIININILTSLVTTTCKLLLRNPSFHK